MSSIQHLHPLRSTFIVIVGSPFEGMVPYGPFSSRLAAETWGESAYPIQEWHIIPLENVEPILAPANDRAETG